MNKSQYHEIINDKSQSGISREHSFCINQENLIRYFIPIVNLNHLTIDFNYFGNQFYFLKKGAVSIEFYYFKDIVKDLYSKSFGK